MRLGRDPRWFAVWFAGNGRVAVKRKGAGAPVHVEAPREPVSPLLGELSQQLIETSRKVRLLAAVTPINWQQQIDRLTALGSASATRAARDKRLPVDGLVFAYPKSEPMRSVLVGLENLATRAEKEGPEGLEIALAAREKQLEARLIDAIGTRSFPKLAAQRYRSSAVHDAMALEWASACESSPPGPFSHPAQASAGGLSGEGEEKQQEQVKRKGISASPSSPNRERRAGGVASAPEIHTSGDERDPRSLVCLLRAEIAKRALPMLVEVRVDLAPLAAMGDRVIYVAASRSITYRDALRTTLHEIEGHTLPWLARQTRGWRGFRAAGESDREEGAALCIEEKAGFLDEGRRQELGLRHVAATMAHAEASHHEIVATLEPLGASYPSAVLIAARALRGGGLGRERVYLPAYFEQTASLT